jgi:CRP-like cAMP-binding protein
MTAPASAQYLKNVGIFAALPEEDLRDLGQRMKPRDYEEGAVIVGQEDRGDSLFAIASGRVKVVLYGDSGREMILSILRENEIFGEMALIDNLPRSATVIALEPTSLFVLERAAFVHHLTSHPSTSIGVMEELSRRLRHADKIIGNLALLDVYGRVAHLLQDLAKREGVETDGGTLIRERPTQQEIAAMIGTSRETVSRALNDFAKRGLVVMNGKQITLRHGFESDLETEEVA